MTRGIYKGPSWVATIVFGLLVWCKIAPATEPSPDPQLRVEAGMHSAPINSISADQQGDLLLTVSFDKTARLWSLHDGRLIRVLRPPIANGPEGRLFAAALSPNGAIAAVAGSTGREWDSSFSIYLFNTASGNLIRRLSTLPGEIESLAFSPDGEQLAAGLWGRNGVRVWRTADWSVTWSDTDYGDNVIGLTFSNSGELITSSWDGYLRSYDSSGHLKLPKTTAPGGQRPMTIALSPNNERVAVGYDDSGRVDVITRLDLQLVAKPDVTGIRSYSLPVVAWSTDGTNLFAGNRPWGNRAPTVVRTWSNGGAGPYRDQLVANNTIMGLAPLSGRDVAFGSFEPTWGVLRSGGRVDFLHLSGSADNRDVGGHFRVSPDGKEVWFSFQPEGELPASFVLAHRQVITRPDERSEMSAPQLSNAGMTVENWAFGLAPTLNNKPLRLYPHEHSRVIAVNGNNLLLGADFSLRLFNQTGSQNWLVSAPGLTRAVNITSDGRLAIAAFADGTIHWYRMADGRELLSLYPHPDRKRWIAWTPQGYYDASVGGDELIGWHVNRGKDHEADFFPARQFTDRFNRPDVVARVLDTLDVGEAVREANITAGRNLAMPVAAQLPPVVKILSPQDSTSVSTSPVEVTYLVRSSTQVTGITVQVDGRPVTTEAPKAIMTGADGSLAVVSVPMPQSDAVISLVASNGQTTSEAAKLHVGWKGEKDWYKPDLYVLAVGVAHYKDKGLTLKYPSKDADDFAGIALAQQGGLYKRVEVRELRDEDATRENIRKGLSWLKKTPTRDVAMLFLSGHGQNDPGGHYHYLPYDTDESDLDLTTIQDFEMEDFLSKVSGKVIVFLDTCFGGGVIGAKGSARPDVDRLANRLASADKGIVVFTSSTGREFSQERDEWQNGAFTKALVEGLKGGADYQHDKQITIAALEVFLAHRVQELTHGEQSPTSAKPNTIQDFVIATVVP